VLEQAPLLVVPPLQFVAHQLLALGAGLGELAGKVFRIGHLGDTNALTLAGALSGVEMALADADVPLRLGAGVGAALGTWRVAS